MTSTLTPAVKVNTDSVMSGDVFYGHFDTVVNDKPLSVNVSNHLKDLKKVYNFRAVSKCRAGFLTVSDHKCVPSEMINAWKKNSLYNIQVEIVYSDGKSLWANVFTTKGNKWNSIDLGFLSVMTVGTMRQSFPDMCDMKLWDMVGAKTWADNAFKKN